jgi:hypothetical protein
MTRPFEVDELLTVRYYTWLCATDSGDVRQITHIQQLHEIPRPTLTNLLVGVYCSAGRWPEPNNHILNSVLVSASLLWERTERASRLPALVGAAIFALALYWLCGPILGWRFAAPLLALWVPFSPFLMEYEWRARGYTWMLALQIVFVLAMAWSARKPTSVGRAAVCAAVAIVSFMNVVNIAIDWLLPVYVSVLFFPPLDDVAAASGDRSAWRRNVVVQMLAVGAVGVTFLVAHLPSVYSSSQQYGLVFDSFSDLSERLAGVFTYLFPGWGWTVFAVLSVVGQILLLRSGRARWLSSMIVFTVVIGIIHVLLARRLPYERGLSYLLPFAFLGTAYVVEQAVRWPSRVGVRTGVWAVCAGLSILLVASTRAADLSNERLDRSLELARQLAPPSGIPTLMLADNGFDYIAAMYRPRQWEYVTRASPGTRLQIVAFLPDDGTHGTDIDVHGGPIGLSNWKTGDWQYHRYPTNDLVSMLQIVGETRSFPDPTVADGRSLIFWYPDISRLGIKGDDQLRVAAASGLRFIARSTRYAAKLDVFANLESIVFIAESPEEYQRVASTVSIAIDSLGGTAVVFVPQR